MKTYFRIIASLQNILLGVSVAILALLPGVLVLYPDTISLPVLFMFAHTSLFLVMIIRPFADIFRSSRVIRPLVILRKGVGVFSASLIVSLIITKYILDPGGSFTSMWSADYWTLQNLTLFAHLADFSAILLLITSNNFSKKLLGTNWKRIQKLSYVYFYGSGLYVYGMLGDSLVGAYLLIVTLLTIIAYFINRAKKRTVSNQAS